MVNKWLFLFSPYFRKFENGVLGSPIWSYFSEIILPKSRYLRGCKIDFLITESIICHIIYQTEEESQCETEETGCEVQEAIEEAGCEAQEAIEEEGCEKKVSRLYSESILDWCDVR